MVESGAPGYVQTIAIGPHRLTADEPAVAGGADQGPNPPSSCSPRWGHARA